MGIPIRNGLIPHDRYSSEYYQEAKISGLPGECDVCQVTGYSKGEIAINGINPGDRVVLIDDVISNGGTMNGIIKALQPHRCRDCGHRDLS